MDKREKAPRFSGIGGHHSHKATHSCLGCGETDARRFGRKGGKLRARCKSCTNVENGKSRARVKASDPKAYLRRGARYTRETRARRSPEHAAALERRGRLKRYGLTVEQFDAMLLAQGNVCGICRQPKDERQWHIDHDHETQEVRGILCSNCNTALGLFKDDPARLAQAIEYLMRRSRDG